MSQPEPTATRERARLLARLDRVPRHAVSRATGIAGFGLFTAFYANFNINVSFIQTCQQIQRGCAPHNAQSWLVAPVALFLVGYMLGGLLVAPLSDRIGRRRGLLLTLGFAFAGSLVTAVCGEYGLFVLGRAITGIGMGATLAVANTYIGEIAPSSARARYTALSFVLCALGATVGIGAGLVGTTEPAPFPAGLPIALGGFESAWRLIYALAVAFGIVALVAARSLPESPRWLLEHDRVDEAESVVAALEQRARGELPEPAPAEEFETGEHETAGAAYRELLTDPGYRRRMFLLVAMWFTGYITVFGYSTGSTSVLTTLGFTAPVAGMISAVGGLGFLVQGLFSAKYSEHLERRYWLPIGAVLVLVGAVLIGAFGHSIGWAFVGSFVLFFGFNVWVPPTFALSAESFPTRVRSAGFGLVDGLGVLGGAAGVLLFAPLVPQLSPLPALLLLSGFLVVAAVLAQFAPRTRNRALEDVSP